MHASCASTVTAKTQVVAPMSTAAESRLDQTGRLYGILPFINSLSFFGFCILCALGESNIVHQSRGRLTKIFARQANPFWEVLWPALLGKYMFGKPTPFFQSRHIVLQTYVPILC